MQFTKTKICNDLIGKPSDMTDEQCGALPVQRWEDHEGQWATSFWKPTQEELAALIDGGVVASNLRVGGRQHPVMFMNVYTKEIL